MNHLSRCFLLSLLLYSSLLISCRQSANNDNVDQSTIVREPAGVDSGNESETKPATSSASDTITDTTVAKQVTYDMEEQTDTAQPDVKAVSVRETVSSKEKVNNADRSKPKKRPQISFKHKSHSFGTITVGDKVIHKFTFTNTGNADLVVKKVDVSCGCTHPSYPFLPIAPGEEGFIGVTFDSKGKLGGQKPTVTVFTNTHPRSHKLYLEGFVGTAEPNVE